VGTPEACGKGRNRWLGSGVWKITDTGRRRIGESPVEPPPAPLRPGTRPTLRVAEGEHAHQNLKRKIKEIGEILGRYAKEEYAARPYVYDVIWKDIEGLPRPSHVFEVQDKGAVDSALAKLQHARDIWRPNLFLVVTGEKDRRKINMLLEPFFEGLFVHSVETLLFSPLKRSMISIMRSSNTKK
jgi:hypothetical protein